MLDIVKLFVNKEGSIGIGSLIIFIAMMVVAGMTATVFIQTMDSMQKQAFDTGRETISDIANGIEVTHITGKINGNNITQMAIFINPVVASDEIDIINVYISLSNTLRSVVLYYNSSYFNSSISNSLFSTMDMTGLDSSSFGIIKVRDIDNSCSSTSPIINSQDIVILMINTSACFGDGSISSGIKIRTEVSGEVSPESGIHGLIRFRTPSSYTNDIIDLQ